VDNIDTSTQYTEDLENAIKAWAKTKMRGKRFKHVVGVVETADQLAAQYAPEFQVQCRIAGWLHDAAKNWDDDELLAYAEDHNVDILPGEYETPMLLHGIVGYLTGAAEFDLDDPVIREACRLHTTGGPNMGTAAKIVFLADAIEPGRSYSSVEAIRAEAQNDLDAALLMTLDHTVKHLIKKKRVIDPRPILLRNQLIRAGVTYTKKNTNADNDTP